MRLRAFVRRCALRTLPESNPVRVAMRMADLRVMDMLAPYSSRVPSRGSTRRHIARMEELPFGVNVVGDFSGNGGISVAAASGPDALRAAGVPVAVVSVSPLGYELSDGPLSYRVNLVHLKPGLIGEFYCGNKADPGLDRYNIGYWAWEMPDLPPRYAAELRFLDEVWAPSSFTAAAIRKYSDIPVRVVPLPVGPPEPPDRARFGFGDGEYVFLVMFDFRSMPERKNPYAAVKAYRSAFGDETGVRLVVKHINSAGHEAELAALVDSAEGSNVTLVGDMMPREEVLTLIASCDCYVSLHRAEGFGLTVAEAMAAGRPVIATGYSGNMDFMDETNSFPVRHTLVRLGRDMPPYSKDDVWADPDIGHAASVMKALWGDPEAGVRTGMKAASDVAERLSYEAVGRVCRERLAEVARVNG